MEGIHFRYYQQYFCNASIIQQKNLTINGTVNLRHPPENGPGTGLKLDLVYLLPGVVLFLLQEATRRTN